MNTPATERLSGAVGSRPLPRGWRSVRLSDVCEESIPTRNPRDNPADSFRYIDITGVSNVSKRIVSPRTIVGKDAPSRARQVIRAGDVLIATTRPNLNAVALVPADLDGEMASTGFCVLRAKGSLDPRYLFWFAQTAEVVRDLSELVKGALYPAVTDAQVRAQWLPLPELPEQQRIVDVLEIQMAAAERARASAGAQLEAAKALPAAYLRGLLDGPSVRTYSRERLGDHVVSYRNGLSRRPQGVERGPIVLRLADVSTGEISLGSPRRGAVTDDEMEMYHLEAGDLLFVRVNGSRDLVGRCVMVPPLPEPVLYNDHLIRVRLREDLRPEWVRLVADFPETRAAIVEKASTSAGQLTINQDTLGSLEIMTPGLEEQKRLVISLADQTSRAKRARTEAEEHLAAINALPGALLRRAFSGEL